ncbi:hypothetical protein LPY66_17700 [Dehalobacter sp. DCM]|uniref:putative ABC transporter permease n=1 Tax=Dehalobacter sp. DCM TaxID=2907827 RepID=UPI003081CC57|nr:hypothetical protein LPY66_17700 [Dehalobacter sp. DCM]
MAVGLDLILYFSLYSFAGWVLETMFASLEQKKFVNRGFLNGCFCPIYGFGAVMIILLSKWADPLFPDKALYLAIYLLFIVFLVTVLEFVTGYLLEKIFHCKWWDYSNYPDNLCGYVSLRFSLLWGVLAFLLIKIVQPEVSATAAWIPTEFKGYLVLVLAAYFLIDTTKTVIDTLDLREVVLNYANVPINHYRKIIYHNKRFFFAFPRLLILNAGSINHDIRSILNERFNKIKLELKNRFQSF